MSTCRTCGGTGSASFEKDGRSFSLDCGDCEEGMRRTEAKRMRKALEDQRRKKQRKKLMAAAGKQVVDAYHSNKQGKLFGAGKD